MQRKPSLALASRTADLGQLADVPAVVDRMPVVRAIDSELSSLRRAKEGPLNLVAAECGASLSGWWTGHVLSARRRHRRGLRKARVRGERRLGHWSQKSCRGNAVCRIKRLVPTRLPATS